MKDYTLQGIIDNPSNSDIKQQSPNAIFKHTDGEKSKYGKSAQNNTERSSAPNDMFGYFTRVIHTKLPFNQYYFVNAEKIRGISYPLSILYYISGCLVK